MRTNLLLIAVFLAIGIKSQEKKQAAAPAPKLIVAIVVDQMRNDYLYRYWDRFSNGGFKRLVNEGYWFKNAHYNYIPTYTGPGHASLFTGTTPRLHGVIANDWFIKENNGWTNCVLDESVKTVGSDSKAGQMSPKNLLSSTVGDELKLSNSRSKVIGISIKDRSAIFPAGHAADAAYWFDENNGNFISSSWYMQTLPAWVQQFNEKRKAKIYLQKGWHTLFPIETYTSSIADNNAYEAAPFKTEPVFPYDFRQQLEAAQLGIIRATPYGNSILKDLALDCIKNESLGKDQHTDLFSISFSSTDIIAHSFGPRSVEVEDVYLRLDRDLEELLNALDQQVGKSNYTVFLSADHGAGDVPKHLKDEQIAAGNIDRKAFKKDLNEFFKNNYGDTALLANLSNEQVFLNEQKINDMKLKREEVEERLCRFLVSSRGIAEAYTSEQMKFAAYQPGEQRYLLQQGYNQKLSGNVCFVLQPGWMEIGDKGTTHGSGYDYDTHVPVLFYGWGIKKGESHEKIVITQIAPTLSELMRINRPNSCTFDPLNPYFK